MKGAFRERILQLALYTVPSLISRSMGVLLLPVYTRVFSLEEFSRLELLLTTHLFLVYGFQFGWNSALVRYYFERGVVPRTLIRTLLTTRGVVYAGLVLILCAVGPQRLGEVMLGDGRDGASLLILALASWMLRDLFVFFETNYRMREQAGRFALVNGAVSVIQTAVILAGMFGAGWGIGSVVIGQAVAYGLVLMTLIFAHRGEMFSDLSAGWLDRAVFRQCARFGLPLVPAAVAMFLVTASDRWMLLWLLPENEAQRAISDFGLGFKVILLVELATSGFRQFFGPYVYRNFHKKNAARRFAGLFSTYTASLFVLAMACAATARTGIAVLFPGFEGALPLIPILLAGFLVYNIGDYFCVGVDIRNQTQIRAAAGILVGVVNVTLNALLIPRFHAAGAAIAGFIGYAVYAATLLGSSHRLFPVPYAWLRWLFAVGWTLFGSVAAQAASPAVLPLFAAVGLVLFHCIPAPDRSSTGRVKPRALRQSPAPVRRAA